MLDLFFVRHGQTDYNAAHIIQGQSDRSALPGIEDLGLNALGVKQAEAAARFLKAQGLRIERVLSSDLKRAAETGKILARAFGLEMTLERGLREMFFGAENEGLTVETFKEKRFSPPLSFTDAESGASFNVADGKTLRDAHKSTAARYANVGHPGGETKNEVAMRARKALETYAKAHPERRSLLIPTHNGLLRFLMPEVGKVDHLECLHVRFDPESGALRLIERFHPPGV